MVIERRAWQWVDWALFGILTSWLGMGILFIFTEAGMGSLGMRFLVAGWVLVSYFATLAVWRPYYTNRLALPFVVLATCGSLEMYLIYLNGREFIGIVTVMLLLIAFHSRGKLLPFNMVLFLVALPVAENLLLMDEPVEFAHLFNHMVSLGSLFALGYGIQRMWLSTHGVKKLYEENLRQYRLIQEQNKALEQYANQVEKLTLLEERNRMARELHDTVGHTFTSVVMGMDAVSYLMDTAPDKAKDKLEVLRQVTRNGLEEVRRSIHQIAPQEEEGTFLQQFSHLAQEFAVHTGTKIGIQQEGTEFELPKQVQLTLIRCLQEALTNAKRHGQAATVYVTLAYLEGGVRLTVSDDGIGSEQLEAGFGLNSMRERLDALQGSLEVTSSRDRGTEVRCRIPIRR
ncbi:sensor histidine kinase [Gorillibacterium sp. sgz5001074]|uniref:sensor histidine kinase n=1 Tax=Gorillibacterium sp. sgz5001074 TaxID=3446695 RepID=UPI003F67BDD2